MRCELGGPYGDVSGAYRSQSGFTVEAANREKGRSERPSPMKRLVINVNVLAVLMGLITYCITCGFLAFQEHPPLRGSLFATVMGCVWLIWAPMGLVASLLCLLPERRLR